MIKIGRNDPCPCGSGKKYKKCCLAFAEDADFQYRRMRQVEARLITRLIKFAFETLGPEVLEEAWRDFNGDDSVAELDAASPMNMVFMPWFLFNWIMEFEATGVKELPEVTIAELFLVRNVKELALEEKLLLLRGTRCPYTLCELIEVKPGVGMTQVDLLRGIEYEVIERSASKSLKRGEIIYCATTEVAGIKSNIGTSPYALGPIGKRDVLELRKWMLDETGDEKITAEHLHEFEQDIRALYLNILKGMFTPPRLSNTDQDPFVPHKLYFDLDSAHRAFQGLKDLAEGWTESELLDRATIEDGLMVKAEIPWLGGSEEAKKRLGGQVLLGLLKIDEKRLVVEVNSKQRAELIRGLVEERLGDSAKYKTTLIEPMESRIEEMWQAAATGTIGLPSSEAQGSEDSDIASLSAQPELRAAMEQIARQHWESWFDLPVPALNGMTPREAAQTEEGRDLLESLLLFYEGQSVNSSEDLMRPDISALRR